MVELLEVAHETLSLWGEEIDYGELADDIAVEARNALHLNKEIHELDQRIAAFLQMLDPKQILRSVPGVGAINAAQILARLGDPNRFRSLAGVRSFSGLVPALNASGVNGHHGSPTKSGDAPLREALYMAANVARQVDPTLGPDITASWSTKASTTTEPCATSARSSSPASFRAGDRELPT